MSKDAYQPSDSERELEHRVDKMMKPGFEDEAPPETPEPKVQKIDIKDQSEAVNNEVNTKKVNASENFTEPSGAPELPKKVNVNTEKPAEPEKLTAAPEPKPDNDAPVSVDDPATDKAVDDIAAHESDELLAAEDAARSNGPEPKPGGNWLKRQFKRKLTWAVVVILILIALAAIPFTRYQIASLLLTKSVELTFLDSETETPVSNASVNFDGVNATTNADGQAQFKNINVGHDELTASKQYYRSYSGSLLVPIRGSSAKFTLKLEATGRQVPVSVVNEITGQPLANATIKSAGTTAETDKTGQATIVLPTTAKAQSATISASGFNDNKAKILVTSAKNKINDFKLTPSGRVYFFSEDSGTLDVTGTNLDGSGQKVLLAGTGSEDPNSTALLASTDWRYLALVANRSGSPEIYVINTKTGALKTVSSAAGNYQLIGWANHQLVYTLTKTDQPPYERGREQIVVFNADNNQNNTLASSNVIGNASSYLYEIFANLNIVQGQLLYTNQWLSAAVSAPPLSLANASVADAITAIYLPNGKLSYDKEFNASEVNNFSSIRPDPNVVDFEITGSGSSVFYDFENDVLQPDLKMSAVAFSKSYPVYLPSPDGQQTFWAEPNVNANELLVGDQNAANAKIIASSSNYQPFGWSGQYLLLTANSQLFVAAPGKVNSPQPISDFYQTPLTETGAGYGFAGNQS